jgi:hypothetical protein
MFASFQFCKVWYYFHGASMWADLFLAVKVHINEDYVGTHEELLWEIKG